MFDEDDGGAGRSVTVVEEIKNESSVLICDERGRFLAGGPIELVLSTLDESVVMLIGA